MFGGGDNEALGGISGMASSLLSPAETASGRGREERAPQNQPQWGHQETKDFIAIRAELEKDFKVAKRNKTLWEIVSSKMRERGYRRTPDQCKCKWKNLVNRYKGKETSDLDNGRQCPFFEELHAVFIERAKSMQRLLVGSGVGCDQAKKKMKRISGDRSSDEFSEEDDDNDDESEAARSKVRKRKAERNVLEKSSKAVNAGNASSNVSSDIHEMLKEFFQQQQRMEMQWREMMERRALERQLFEQEWRQSMEKLEKERLMVELAWREKEEQRRMREESRAERRDALLTTLLNKLINEN